MAKASADPVALENRFMEVNRARLERLAETLSARQWDLLCAIPTMLHLNSRDLPGYIDDQTPSGVRNFLPDSTAISALTKLVSGYRHQSAAVRTIQILSIFMMGSSGSIAFTAHSDFDLWVCVDNDMEEKDRAQLQQKFTSIEIWADKFGLELHFFIVDRNQFRSAGELTLSGESSGTAQRFLLLEEFYRTATLMAGLPPLWWIVPVEHEAAYDEFAASLNQWPNVRSENYIDFGPLDDVPVEEFTGAGLWQVFKGIDSPYKSVMKMILMEAYINEHPHTRLVSLDYKQKVQQGITELERLDPYLLMFEKADAYLVGNNQPERAELLRHCFYLKIGDHLSRKPSVPSPRRDLRRRLMANYVKAWGWPLSRLEALDQREHWRIGQVMTETRDIHRELGNSYTQLSRLAADRTATTAISKADLHVLGRRIYAALERKPGKVEIVNRNPKQIATEETLLIRKARNRNGSAVWLLHDSTASGDETNTPLKRFSTPIELLLWCWLNGVASRQTRWITDTQQTGLGEREISLLNRFIEEQLPIPEVLRTTTDDLAAPLRYTRMLILVNFGFERFASYSRKGLRLASARTDPLSYGDSKVNTIGHIDMVYHSAWGEIICHSISGDNAAGEALQRYLGEMTNSGNQCLVPAFFGFSEHDGHGAAQRIENLFIQARQNLNKTGAHNSRLIYASGPGFSMIEKTAAGVTTRGLADREILVEALSQTPPGAMVTHIDAMVTDLGDLAVITDLNELGSIQLFIDIDGSKTRFHLLDEGGAYLEQNTETYELQGHLQHLNQFVENISNRLKLAQQGNDAIPITYYQLKHSASGVWLPREVELTVAADANIIDIHALAVPAANGSHALSILFEGEEFSSLEWGHELYQRVAEQILRHRQKGETYPAYITDIELAQPANGELPLQAIHYFKYKKSIEERLTSALRAAATGDFPGQSAQI